MSFSCCYVYELEGYVEILYSQLLSRRHHISHQKGVVQFEDHRHFVLNNSYRAWFFIFFDGACIGNFYLKNDNSIGINLVEEIKSCVDFITKFLCLKFEPLPEIKSLVPAYFYINIPYNDKFLDGELNALGTVLIQKSFRI